MADLDAKEREALLKVCRKVSWLAGNQFHAAPIEDTPIEDTSIEDTSIEDTLIEDTPIVDTPIEDILSIDKWTIPKRPLFRC